MANPNIKPGPGRPKGSKSKVTSDLRYWIDCFIRKQAPQIEADFAALEPRDRVALFERLLKFALPALQSTQLNADIVSKLTNEQVDRIIEELKAK